MGGMVLETNMNEIITQVDAQNKMEKSEVSLTLRVLYCMYDLTLPPYSRRHRMQYAGMCVCCTLHATLKWPCGCSLPTLECLCSSFRPLLSLLHCSVPTQGLNISSPVSLSIKVQYHSHHLCHYYGDLTVSLSSASLAIESLNHHLIFDHKSMKTGWL